MDDADRIPYINRFTDAIINPANYYYLQIVAAVSPSVQTTVGNDGGPCFLASAGRFVLFVLSAYKIVCSFNRSAC